MESFLKIKSVKKYRAGNWEFCDDKLILEAPLTVFFNDEEIFTFLFIEDLALGFSPKTVNFSF